MPPVGEIVLRHVHNKVVHFPIALSLAAVGFLALGRRRPGFEEAARWLIVGSAIAAIAAFVTGRLQAGGFRGDPREWMVSVHERWGIATAVAILVWGALASSRRWRRFAAGFGVLVVTLVLVTAMLGGVVAHGE